jgi:hypothetical protein
MRRVHEVYPFLDSLQTDLHTINSALNANDGLLDGRHSSLQLAHIVGKSIDLLIDTTEKYENDVIGLICHFRAPISTK